MGEPFSRPLFRSPLQKTGLGATNYKCSVIKNNKNRKAKSPDFIFGTTKAIPGLYEDYMQK